MNWKVEFTLGYGPATCANEFQLPGRGGGIAFRHRGISISHNRLRTVCSNTKREWSLLCKVTLLFHSARAPEQGFSCFLAVCCFMSASMRAVICHRCFLTYSFSLWCRECKHLRGSFLPSSLLKLNFASKTLSQTFSPACISSHPWEPTHTCKLQTWSSCQTVSRHFIVTSICTAVLSEAWAKLREWAVLAG